MRHELHGDTLARLLASFFSVGLALRFFSLN